MSRLSVALITAISAMALTQIASAAAPLSNWMGPYVGIAGGYGWGHSNQTDSGIPCNFFNNCPPPAYLQCGAGDGSYAVRGGMIGATLGYNWQYGPWVFGVESDYSWADINGSSNTCGATSPVPHACGTKLQSLGTLRARIGYAVGATGNWLPYLTGGPAVGDVRAWDALYPASGCGLHTGWTLGGGVEASIAQNWTFKVEYLYADLGSHLMFNVVPGVPETVSFTANIIRVGVNYKFN